MANSSPPQRATMSVSRTSPCKPAGHCGEQLVAARVAEAVVDLLEVVEIEEQNVGAFDFVAAPAQRFDQFLFEASAIG